MGGILTADSSLSLTGRMLTEDPQGPRLIEVGDERIFRFDPVDPKEPKGEVLLIHGLAGHPGRRFTTARLMAQRGFAVTLFDLVGHGGRQESWEKSRHIYRSYAVSDDPSVIRKSFGPLSGESEFLRHQYPVLKGLRIRRLQEQIDFMLQQALPRIAPAPQVPLFLIAFSGFGLLSAGP